MEPWYRLVTPRREVREGRSFNPDEFAIALEQVVAGSAPDTTTRSPSSFSHGPVSRALRDNSGLEFLVVSVHLFAEFLAGRVDLGGCPPKSPTDPGLHITRTRFLIS